MPSDGNVELLFPLAGLHEGMEYEQQPGATTPSAVNVRGNDCRSGRQRGASRPGLAKFILPPVSAAGQAVQMLNSIVTTGLAALSANYSVEENRIGVDYTLLGPDAFGNPGWVILTGGTGIQPNSNISNIEAGQDQEITHRQNKTAFHEPTAGVSRSEDVAFTSDVTLGDLLVVAIGYAGSNQAEYDVSDSQSNLYTQVAIVGGVDTGAVAMYHARAGADGPNTVTVDTVTNAASVGATAIACLNYYNSRGSTPFVTDTAQGEFPLADWPGGDIDITLPGVTTQDGDMVLTAWVTDMDTYTFAFPAYTPPDPDQPTYTQRVIVQHPTDPFSWPRLIVSNAVPVKATPVLGGKTVPRITVTPDTGFATADVTGLAVAFRKA